MKTYYVIREKLGIKEKIAPLLKEYKVTRAGIFGSYARGEQNEKSDVDILIDIDKEADLFDLIRLKYLLEKKIGKKVDLVEYELIRPEIKERILKEEVCCYEKFREIKLV